VKDSSLRDPVTQTGYESHPRIAPCASGASAHLTDRLPRRVYDEVLTAEILAGLPRFDNLPCLDHTDPIVHSRPQEASHAQ
jgi:hypothetical protein